MDYDKTWQEFALQLNEEVKKRFTIEQICEYQVCYAKFVSEEIRNWLDKHPEVDIYEGIKQLDVEDI